MRKRRLCNWKALFDNSLSTDWLTHFLMMTCSASLCAHSVVIWNTLPGEIVLLEVADELVDWAEMRGLLDTLVAAVRDVRPNQSVFRVYPNISENFVEDPFVLAYSPSFDTRSFENEQEVYNMVEPIVECFSVS